MKKICIGLLFSTLLVLVTESDAQQTGSFDMTVNFAGDPNFPIAFYVPSNYNPANKYKLVVGLHGLGGTCQGYRNYLASNIVSNGSSPVYNAIVVAPGNGDGSNTDYWTFPCDTSIISTAMNLAISNYNIDPEYIYLNGISLGGRAALRYGLINYKRFRGLELWCPAIQSLAEANNQTSFVYPYQNGKYIPVCISVGSEDGYVQNGQIPAAMVQFTNLGAPASMQIELGLPHGPPSNSYVFSCYAFDNAQASTYVSNDAGISDIVTPFDEECTTVFSPVVNIQNKGTNNLLSAVINYQLDNGPVQTYNWSGNLKRLEKSSVTLPAQTVSWGAHTFNAYTTLPNSLADAIPSNDAITKSFTVLTNGSLSLSEGFQNAVYPPVGWKHAGSDKVWTWDKINGVGAGGSSSCIRFDNYTYDKTGKKYSIRTAEYDLSGSVAPVLSYDYAYAPLNSGGLYTDTLAVYYSVNCGSTWTPLLVKGGMALSSTGSSTSNFFIPASSSQWKNQTINLSGLMGQPKVMFAFESRPGWGNLMYLDNINLTGTTGIWGAMPETPVFIYPNPMDDRTTILPEAGMRTEENHTIHIIDITGKTVREIREVSGFPFHLDRGELSAGIYLIELRAGQQVARKKLVVN